MNAFPAIPLEPRAAADEGRPRYHYAPRANWLSDPNGLIRIGGLWHLFYQHNPHGEDWGHMSWGHAISRDLAEWEELPLALLEDERHAIFSGCAVLDRHGAAGFGAGALIAAYTGASKDPPHQSQCLAFSHDDGASWTKFAGNPVLDLGMADFRDPNIVWHEPTAQWVMLTVLSAENRALLHGSTDLRHWTELSSIGPFDLPGGVWECPALVELPVEGLDETRWMFKVDTMVDGPGSGALAVFGTFDGRDFVADRTPSGAIDWQTVDLGRDFYAAVPWHEAPDAAGRPCWIGWMGNHGYQSNLPQRGWRGMMSLPKRLSLRRTPEGHTLVQDVEPSIATRFDAQGTRSGQFAELIDSAARLCFAKRPQSGHLSISGGDGSQMSVHFDEAGLRLDRSAGFHEHFDAPVTVPLDSGPLTFWLDAGTVEIESARGARWASFHHRSFDERVGLTGELPDDCAVGIAAWR